MNVGVGVDVFPDMDCCSVLQCVAVCCSVLQCGAVCCSVLQCGAVCCSVLPCVAVCCSVFSRYRFRATASVHNHGILHIITCFE